MSQLYITENGAFIGVEENRITVKYKDGMLRTIPIETIDGITVIGKSQFSVNSMETCMKKGIPVAFFSKGGRYFGRLMSTGHIKAVLQRKQAALYDSDFALELSRSLISAKISNQLVVLRRYARDRDVDIDDSIINMINSRKKIAVSESIDTLMGYEGTAVRSYFEGLSKCIDEEFKFSGRSKRPPMDEFNSLISLGYSVMMNEIYCEIESVGLNPYFGFMHRDAEKHPTLASDLIEEWRAVLIDSMAMSLINGHEIRKEHFLINVDEPGCFLTREGLRIFIKKLEDKLQTRTKYIQYVDYPVDFRRAVHLQAGKLAEAIKINDPTVYTPVLIR